MSASSVSATASTSFSPVLGGAVGEIGRDLLDCVVLALLDLAAPRERAHLDQVDDADEVVLGTDGQLDRQRLGVEPLLDRARR